MGKMEISDKSSNIGKHTKWYKYFFTIFFGRKIVLLGSIIIIVFILAAALAPWISPYDPYETNPLNTLQKPSLKHLLGTDSLGRDTLSRIIYGARISWLIGIFAVSIAFGIGITLGVLAGFFGSWINTIIMRFIDALLSIPPIILALALAAVLGGGLKNVMIAVGISFIPTYTRIMCAQVLAVKQSDYILAAHVIGAKNLHIILRHVIPNCLPPIIVQITLNMGLAILIEAGLSFLGVGITIPTAAWGSMVNTGYRYLITHPILSFAPGCCIMFVVLSFNLVGDGLRDALDPRLRGVI